MKAAFTLLDFGPEEQETIVKILSAILLLGELRLIEKDQVVELGNADLVEKSEQTAFHFYRFALSESRN